MRHIPDATGRLPFRPYYAAGELDELCEELITTFVTQLHGRLTLPIPTDDLEKLLERDAAELDLYADLSAEGDDVEGVTYFISNEKPRVCISRSLSGASYREHRLRTTLSHEYGHVKLHAPLWDTPATQLPLFTETNPAVPQQCHRATILGGTSPDWMEWQAGYVSGALLMPLTVIRPRVQSFFAHHTLPSHIQSASSEAIALQQLIADACDVSRDAARVRLTKLGYFVDDHPGAQLLS